MLYACYKLQMLVGNKAVKSFSGLWVNFGTELLVCVARSTLNSVFYEGYEFNFAAGLSGSIQDRGCCLGKRSNAVRILQ